MNNHQRRQLLTSLGIGSLGLLAQQPSHAKQKTPSQTIVTITGNVHQSNRAGLNPALDQLFIRHASQFNKAFALDLAMLQQLKQHSIKPTIEYDQKQHMLTGPYLSDVLHLTNPNLSPTQSVQLRALDGYLIKLSLDDLQQQKFLLAHSIDQQPLAIGGLGPTWAIIDADNIPNLAKRPIKERFSQCPWGLYHIHLG